MKGSFENPQTCRRAVFDHTSHEARTRDDRTDCRTHRLGVNLPTGDSAEVCVPLLLQSYQEQYPADPVIEQDFEKLIKEMRGKSGAAGHQTTPKTTNTYETPQGRSVAKQVSPTNNDGEHETVDERDGSLDPHTTSIFKEFVSGWRNLNSNGAMSNDTAGRRAQRKLDVLSWGFGE
jgi:hypothetical protein